MVYSEEKGAILGLFAADLSPEIKIPEAGVCLYTDSFSTKLVPSSWLDVYWPRSSFLVQKKPQK